LPIYLGALSVPIYAYQDQGYGGVFGGDGRFSNQQLDRLKKQRGQPSLFAFMDAP
jgi:hypothetical protein